MESPVQRSILIVLLTWCLGAAPVALAQTRDPLKWPFSKTSIWNIPIHNNAVYKPANIQDAPNFAVDEDIIILTPNAPLLNVETNYAGWDRGKDRCLDEGPTLFSAPIPANWIYDKTVWDGLTPNSGASILLPDNRIIQTQPFAKCGTEFATSQFTWPANDCVLTGECITGAHGGSGLSTIGGTVRVGEFTAGEIKHVVKLNLFGKENFYHDANGGYRWPAYKADGGYNDPAAPNYYGGTNPELKIGALLALHKDLVLSSLTNNSLGLETEAGLILARTLQNYGGYTVDNTAWDSYALITEIGPNGSVRQEFKNLYGYDMGVYGSLDNSPWGRDLKRLFTNLQVISNNAAGNSGGGPVSDLTNRRAPAAPDFLPAQTFKIMPLGDSKTEGGGGVGQQSSWRGFLRTKLMRAGYSIDYVGDRRNTALGDTLPYDYDHAGHGGYTIGPDINKFCATCETTGLYEHIQDWLPAANPDLVLLAIGVNDMFGDNIHAPGYRASAPQRYQDLVNKILELKPGVRLVLGTVEPVKWDKNWGSNPSDQSLGALNAKIREIANASTTDNIFLADVYASMYATWDPGDFFDDLHLSVQGATKGANAWFDVLVPVLNNVPDNVAPTAVLTAPANHATYAAPASITLAVDATDPDGSIAKVEFYSGRVKIGEDTSAPFSFTWNNVDEGTYLLKAVAVDNLFGSGSTGVDTVRVTSTDGYVPFTGTGIGSPGSYGNSGMTFDKALDGNLTTYFDGPAAGGQWVGLDLGAAKIVRKVRIVPRTAWAQRIVGGKIQASNAPDFTNAVDLYTFTETPLEGVYTTARFTPTGLYRYYRFLSSNNGYGNISELEFWGNANDPVNQVPTCSLVTPLANATYAPGSTLYLSAAAGDPDGTISKVDFFSGTTLVGTANQAPFEYTWTNVPAGAYLITARATDNAGVTKISDPVSITVSTNAANGLYAENFNTNTAAGWVVNGGTWTAANQRYESTNTNGEFTSYYGGASFSNYTYALTATAVWDNNIGFLFNYQNTSNYYILVINTKSKAAELRKRVNGTFSSLGTAVFTGGGTGVSHQIEIRNAGGSTTVRINQNTVFSNVATPEFTSGKIGLYSFYCPSRFDNVLVTSNNAAPAVSLTSPADNASAQAPATLTLTAAASDPDGSISKVEFFSGATLLATVTASPFTYTWTGVPRGTYYLTARATDDGGASLTSSLVRATVAPAAEAISFNNPPMTVHAGGTYAVNVNYVASTNRFIDVYLYNAQWQRIASKHVPVAAGSGTQAVAITVPAGTVPNTGAIWAVNLWAGDWSSVIKSGTTPGVTIQAAAAGSLTLTSVCSTDPAQARKWRVTSTFPYAVEFNWSVYKTSQTGKGVVDAQGTTYFETATVAGDNTVVIGYGLNATNTKASGGAACSARKSGEKGGAGVVAVSPNPASRTCTVSYPATVAQTVRLSLRDMVGGTRIRQTEAARAGVNQASLEVGSLPNGLYLLNIAVDGKQLVQKVMVHH